MISKTKTFLFKFLAPLLLSFFAFAEKAFAAGDVESGLSQVRTPFGSSGWLTGATSVPDLITGIIRIMLMLAGAIAVVFVIIGGYRYLTSNGNEESAEQGQKTITNAIIGIVVIILAWVIINVIVRLVTY